MTCLYLSNFAKGLCHTFFGDDVQTTTDNCVTDAVFVQPMQSCQVLSNHNSTDHLLVAIEFSLQSTASLAKASVPPKLNWEKVTRDGSCSLYAMKVGEGVRP